MHRAWCWTRFAVRLVVACVLIAIPLVILALGFLFFLPDPALLEVHRWKDGLIRWTKEPLRDEPLLSTEHVH